MPDAAAPKAWYYARAQDRLGPVSEPDLRALAARGELSPATLVWTDGMPDWTTARTALPALFPGVPPAIPAPHGAPPTAPSGVPRPPQGDATGGIIPYKNPPALMAYYTGIFSIIPLFPVGLIALGLGIAGLKKRARQPEVKGAVHAWIGIIVGGFFGLLWLAATVLLVIASMQR